VDRFPRIASAAAAAILGYFRPTLREEMPKYGVEEPRLAQIRSCDHPEAPATRHAADRLNRIGLAINKNMSATRLTKHALRTRETREQLLKAAAIIFGRDGFEKADLGAIAALAGRTRGAIYAQFKSKEDVFLALMEQKTQEYRAEIEKLFEGSTNKEQKLEAYRQFCMKEIEDREWSLLTLEFKLFAIRHPESRERLHKFYDAIFTKDQENRLVSLIGTAGGNEALDRSLAVQTLQPLLTALAVESRFAPALLSKSSVKKVAMRIFDALMQPPAK
jgi:AcrR family transcriptional regulator